MHLKNFKKDFYSYALFSFFSAMAFVIVSVSAVDFNKQAKTPVKAETVVENIWIGTSDGALQSCNTNGDCTSYGDKGLQILSLGSFAGKVWLSQLDGTVQSCDSSGTCTSVGDQGTFAYNMAEHNNNIWIGEDDGTLVACDANGTCTNYGDKGNGINGIASFANQIWIGQNDGKLQACDTSGNCTDYGTKSSAAVYANRITGIISMAVFSDKLWLCTETGELKSCDSSGECISHGDLGYFWNNMVVYDNKLWLFTSDGFLHACDADGNCTNYGDKTSEPTTNFGMVNFDNKLWLSIGKNLYSCDNAGNCTDLGDKGGIVIQDMVAASVSEPSITCTDTDGGKSLYAKGTVNGLSASGGAVEYTDECFDGTNYGDGYKYVVEWSCSEVSENVIGDHFRCPNGCVDGACIELSATCTAAEANSLRCYATGNSINEVAKMYSQKCANNLWSNMELCTNGCANGSCIGNSSGGGSGSGSGDSNNATSTEKKVTVCHIPPGNASNKKTIEVGESAVKALLDQGSYLGKCIEDQNKTDNNASSTVKQNNASSTLSSTEEKVKDDKKVEENKKIDDEITVINSKAKDLKDNKIDALLAEIKVLRDQVKEQFTQIQYLQRLISGNNNVSDTAKDAINSFITYGVDDNTKKLGAGERAAVMYSYKEAYSKLPESEAELADAIKIANGRWPGETSSNAETKAKDVFINIYQHVADMADAKDNAAVTIMAYGLRQKAENRNLNSESQALKTFKEIYGHVPSTTEEWNILQAITYSGATRDTDSDNDLLSDEQEAKFGTDPKKSDTDGDGYIDGIEVNAKYNPKGEGKLE